MLVAESLGRLFVSWPARARDLGSLVPTPTRLAAQIRTTFDGLRWFGHYITPQSVSSIQGGIGPHRRWSAAHADLAEIKTIKRAFGGTVNDVMLAVIAGAFRDLLADLDEDPDHAVLRTPSYRYRCGPTATARPITRSRRSSPSSRSGSPTRSNVSPRCAIRWNTSRRPTTPTSDRPSPRSPVSRRHPSSRSRCGPPPSSAGSSPKRAVGTVTTNVRGSDHTL